MIDPNSPIRLGIVGLGAMGGQMYETAVAHPEVTLVSAADLIPDLVERRRAEHPAVTFTTDPLQVVTAPDIDAVYLAVPPAAHADLTIAALAAGKAVFCEKPLAVSIADGERMVRAAQDSGLVGAVNYALSDRNSVLRIERALHSGEVGDVAGVDIQLTLPVWPRAFQAHATWLAGREQGGLLREVFSHFVYLTDRFLGPLTVEHVDVTFPADDPTGAEIHAMGVLSAGGVRVYVTARTGFAGPARYEWTLWGTKRSYRLVNWAELVASDGGPWTTVDLAGERGSEASRLSLFVAAMRGKSSPHLADFATALRVQRVVEAFHA